MLPLLCLANMSSAFLALLFAKVAASKYHRFHGLSNRDVFLHCRRQMERQTQVVSPEVLGPTQVFSLSIFMCFSLYSCLCRNVLCLNNSGHTRLRTILLTSFKFKHHFLKLISQYPGTEYQVSYDIFIHVFQYTLLFFFPLG